MRIYPTLSRPHSGVPGPGAQEGIPDTGEYYSLQSKDPFYGDCWQEKDRFTELYEAIEEAKSFKYVYENSEMKTRIIKVNYQHIFIQ